MNKCNTFGSIYRFHIQILITSFWAEEFQRHFHANNAQTTLCLLSGKEPVAEIQLPSVPNDMSHNQRFWEVEARNN